MNRLPVDMIARVDQVHRGLVDHVALLVNVVRSHPLRSRSEQSARLVGVLHQVLGAEPGDAWASLLAVTVVELSRTDWHGYTESLPEGTGDPSPVATEPLGDPIGDANIPTAEEGNENG